MAPVLHDKGGGGGGSGIDDDAAATCGGGGGGGGGGSVTIMAVGTPACMVLIAVTSAELTVCGGARLPPCGAALSGCVAHSSTAPAPARTHAARSTGPQLGCARGWLGVGV